MARATMAQIIARVRLLINDRATPPIFADDDIQETLDTYRTDNRYLPLLPVETISGPPTQGVVTWLDYYAPDGMGWWEQDLQLLSNVYAPLTPATSDYNGGHWTFTTSQQPPVYLVGKSFDIFAAAADTLEQWIALLKLEYDTRQGRLDLFNRSQRIASMQALIDRYRRNQMVQTAVLMRPDTPARTTSSTFDTAYPIGTAAR